MVGVWVGVGERVGESVKGSVAAADVVFEVQATSPNRRIITQYALRIKAVMRTACCVKKKSLDFKRDFAGVRIGVFGVEQTR